MVRKGPVPQRLPVEVEVEQAQAVKTALPKSAETEATGSNGRRGLAPITEAVVVEERIPATF
jgi:hypothetical protein